MPQPHASLWRHHRSFSSRSWTCTSPYHVSPQGWCSRSSCWKFVGCKEACLRNKRCSTWILEITAQNHVGSWFSPRSSWTCCLCFEHTWWQNRWTLHLSCWWFALVWWSTDPRCHEVCAREVEVWKSWRYYLPVLWTHNCADRWRYCGSMPSWTWENTSCDDEHWTQARPCCACNAWRTSSTSKRSWITQLDCPSLPTWPSLWHQPAPDMRPEACGSRPDRCQFLTATCADDQGSEAGLWMETIWLRQAGDHVDHRRKPCSWLCAVSIWWEDGLSVTVWPTSCCGWTWSDDFRSWTHPPAGMEKPGDSKSLPLDFASRIAEYAHWVWGCRTSTNGSTWTSSSSRSQVFSMADWLKGRYQAPQGDWLQILAGSFAAQLWRRSSRQKAGDWPMRNAPSCLAWNRRRIWRSNDEWERSGWWDYKGPMVRHKDHVSWWSHKAYGHDWIASSHVWPWNHHGIHVSCQKKDGCENGSTYMSCEDKRGTPRYWWAWHGNVKQPLVWHACIEHLSTMNGGSSNATKRCEPCFAASCGPLSQVLSHNFGVCAINSTRSFAMVPMLIFLLLASPALGIRLDGSVGAVEVPKKGETRKTDVSICVYMCLSFVPKFFNFVWGSRLPSPRILNETDVWVEGLDIFWINHESAKDKCECPGKNCCGDDSLVCDVKTRTCKPSLGSLCSSNYFFTECASKDTYNVSTECALSAAGYHRCCIKSGQPLFACAVFA